MKRESIMNSSDIGLYERACQKVNRAFGPDREALKESREEKKSSYQEKAKELRKAEGELAETEVLKDSDPKKHKKAKKRFERAEKSYKAAKRDYKREGFKKTLYFTGMDLQYEEVILFAGFMALITFFISLTGIMAFRLIYKISLFEFLTYVIPILLISPIATLIFTANYPEIKEKRLKAESVGKAPESINYMTMSMRVRPSLYRAISFSAKSTEEPMSTGLNKVLWDVHTRKKASIEESFVDFALEWGNWNKDLKRSLFAVRSAMLEKTKEGLNSALEKANEIIIDGTKRQVEDFANSLSTPTTILFAIGILLPLIIGAMLPMLALGGLDIGVMGTGDGETTKAGIGLVHIILLMDIVSPVGAFLYSYKILGDRPGTVSPPEVEEDSDKKRAIITSIILALAVTLPVFHFSTILKPVMPLPYLWGLTLGISYYCLSTSWSEKKERNKILEMEREFPDALFQLGSRIAEGIPPEAAFKKTADSMKGTDIGELLEKITCTLQINRLPLESALFGGDGVLEGYPSKTIRATMKTVVELTKKDPKEGGKTIVQISRYLRDMEEMDHEIRSRLSQSVGMMKGTAMVFAPVVMGVVSSLYFMLQDIFTQISNIEMISPSGFTGVLGIYLILMGMVITYFTSGIKSRLDLVEFKFDLGIVISVSITIFSVSVFVGKIGIAG